MPDGRVCYVDDVVRSASNDVRNVVAIDTAYCCDSAVVAEIIQLTVFCERLFRTISSEGASAKDAVVVEKRISTFSQRTRVREGSW